jgi:hypothetical protein
VGKTAGSTIGASLHAMSAASQEFTGGHRLNISEMHVAASSVGGGLDSVWDMLIISTRDPLSRTVSAFNYELENSNAHELLKQMEECFPSPGNGSSAGAIEEFANALSGASTKCGKLARRCTQEAVEKVWERGKKVTTAISYCGHMNLNHKHYLAHVHSEKVLTPLNAMRAGVTRAYVVRSESVEEDLKGLWSWLCMPPDAWNDQKFIPATNHIPVAYHTDGSLPRHQDTWLSKEGRASLIGALVNEYQVIESLEQLADNGHDADSAPKVQDTIASMPHSLAAHSVGASYAHEARYVHGLNEWPHSLYPRQLES